MEEKKFWPPYRKRKVFDMSSHVNFFDKAGHKLAQLRAKHAASPRTAAVLFALWALEKAAGTHLSGDRTPTSSKDDDSPLTMAALVRGGIGDAVLSTAFLHALAEYADVPVLIDVYSSSSPEIVSSLCYGHPVFRKVASLKDDIDNNYDIVVDITRMAWFPGMNRRKTARLAPHLFKFMEDCNKFHHEHHFFFTDEGQRIGMDYADTVGVFRQGQMDVKNVLHLKNQRFAILCEEDVQVTRKAFGLGERYITLHRESGNSGKGSLKLWPEDNYHTLIVRLKEQYPHIDIVFLGSKKDGDFPGTIDLRGRTSFPVLKALLKGAALHVGGEGLMPHLRHFLHGGPSVVLFGPTSCRHYGYAENCNINGTLCPEGCEWISQDWQQTCIKGFSSCRCMDEISVSHVMEKISASLSLHSSTGGKQ